MIEESQRVVAEFVGSLPGYLTQRVVALGADPDRVSNAIGECARTARDELSALLGRPFDRQGGTPLEVIRRATAIVGDALAAIGLTPPDRDEEQARVAPDDPYGLAPASPAELGDGALEASLVWGVAKTAAMTRPLLLVVTTNLMDASRFEPVAAAAGYRMESRRDTHTSTTPLVGFVDLTIDGSDDVIRELAGHGVRVVGYGPHVDDQALIRARALGAIAAEPRSRMFRDPSAYLPPLV